MRVMHIDTPSTANRDKPIRVTSIRWHRMHDLCERRLHEGCSGRLVRQDVRMAAVVNMRRVPITARATKDA